MDHQPDPVTLSWENINVFVPWKKKKSTAVAPDVETGVNSTAIRTANGKKQILSDVTGVVGPGSLVAVIGASGAGKSTFMNVLSNRNLKGYQVEGEVKVNGVTVGSGIRSISAYVQQDCLFLSTLTVRETLTFRAVLRMDKCIKKKARLQRVEQLIQEMGLSNCANSRIGWAGGQRGISGGELKRLLFACEMLTNPALLFCDEPTSGLDFFMAQKVVKTLQEMASKNRTILCIIHQPSSEIFAMFDRVLLMAEGRMAFMGNSAQAMAFFNSLNHRCPSNYNPSDFYILTLAIKPGKEEQCRKKVNAICDSFTRTQNAKKYKELISKVTARSKGYAGQMEEAVQSESRYEASWCQQFRTVLWRSWVCVFRDVYLFRVRALQSVFIAVLLGLIFLRLNYDQKGVMNVNGALFILVINFTFTSALSIINSFPHELGVFLREYGSGLYRTDVYFISKNLAELPTFVFIPLLCISIAYWMIGLNDGWQNFLVAAAINVLVANIAASFGLLTSILAGDVNVALAVTVPAIMPLVLFGGFFLNADTVPVYFIWLEHISWFKYAMEILSVNQWESIGSIDCDANVTCQFTTGKSVLEYHSFSASNLWPNVGALFALLVGFRVLAFVGLLIRARRSKT